MRRYVHEHGGDVDGRVRAQGEGGWWSWSRGRQPAVLHQLRRTIRMPWPTPPNASDQHLPLATCTRPGHHPSRSFSALRFPLSRPCPSIVLTPHDRAISNLAWTID